MCTLPIFPTAGGGYLLGHNRDESRGRPPGEPPAVRGAGAGSWIAPRDPEGGGTWIGLNSSGIAYALLNAAHIEADRLPPRPPTRGRILDAVLLCRTPDEVLKVLEADPLMAETRGFHLVMVRPGAGSRGAEALRFRWDGRSLESSIHGLPALFISSGYDQASAEAARGASWRRFLEESPDASAPRLARWLASHHPRRGLFSVCMHGEGAGTVSRTLVETGGGRASMAYHAGPPCRAGMTENRVEIPVRS